MIRPDIRLAAFATFAVFATFAMVAFRPAVAVTTLDMKDGSTFEVTATSPEVPYPYGDTVIAFGVERRATGGPFPRSMSSLAAVKFGDWPVVGTVGESIDRRWGDNGLSRIPVWGEEDEYLAHAVDGKGRILVLGRAPDPAEIAGDERNLERNNDAYNQLARKYYLSLVRLLPDGRPDPGFNGNGRVLFHLAPLEDPWDDKTLNRANVIEVLADGTLSLRQGSNPGLPPDGIEIARVSDSGKVDAQFRPFGDRGYANVRAAEIAFEPAIEFVNDRDQYFFTASPAEAGFVDRGGAGRWYRTGYAIRTFVAGQPGNAAQPVCRFYGDPRLGLGNHFYTADSAECALLADNPSLGWKLEARDVFRLEKPDPVTGACGAGRDAVFRLLALRRDSAHRYTTDWNLARAAVASGRWIKEGFGPDQIAMCASSP